MAQIKPMPTHIREYYKAMKDAFTQKKEEAEKKREELILNIYVLQSDIMNRHDVYLKYDINLSEFPEFINNEYQDGHFLRVANGAYLNKKNDYELTTDLFHLLTLAKQQEEIYNLGKLIDKYNKILSIKTNEYVRYMREFFNEVHKKLILEGCAYHFGNGLGDVIINRVKYTKRNGINYKATKERKAEILANGGRLYNKEEAEFCERNGIEYDGQDGRVFMNSEYFYEVFIANRKFKDATTFSFNPQDYRAPELRGKTNEQLIEECNRDLGKICELKVDLKTKITMCCAVNQMLYTNFIRNENQTSYKYSEVGG